MMPPRYKTTLLLLVIYVASVQAFFGVESWALSGGLCNTNSRAAEAIVAEMGGNPDGGTALIIDLQTRNTYGNQEKRIKLRYGVLISALHEWNYWDTPDSIAYRYNTYLGQGYGAYRLAFLPEVYTEKGDFEFAFGSGIGFGYSIHFFDDNIGNNDNQGVFEGFIRPQISAAYGNKVKFELLVGYHLPFLGTFGEYWCYDQYWNEVRYAFSPSEMASSFLQVGVVFIE